MKFIKFLVIIFLISCEPEPLEPTSNTVYADATLNYHGNAISLGDTLKISLLLGDSVYTNNGLIQVSTLDKAEFDMIFYKIDTTDNSIERIWQPHYWTTRGSILNSTRFRLDNNTKPYGVDINFKPPTKGLFAAEVTNQPGEFYANGNSFYGNMSVRFDIPNRNLDLAIPFFGQDWANQVQTSIKGIYFFRVQ